MQAENNIPKKIIEHYPWLEGSQEYLNEEIQDYAYNNNINYEEAFIGYIEEILEYQPYIIDNIRSIFSSAINKMEDVAGIIIREGKEHIVMYQLIKMILTVLNQKFLDNHVANLLAGIYVNHLKKKKEVHELKVLANYMGITCELSNERIGGIRMPFMVDVFGYVRFSSFFKDNRWALVNQYVKNGYVYILKDTLIRALKELIRVRILPQRGENLDKLLQLLLRIRKISELMRDIKFEIGNYQQKLEKERGVAKYDMDIDGVPSYQEFPPCIKYILDKAENGHNLTHSERLHIAFFYANVGFSVEETVDVFRTVPDFNEEIARYNVEFSRGIGGKGKKYKVYSCSKLKSEHLCQASHPIFGSYICSKGVTKKDGNIYKMRTPLDFIFWYRVEQMRKKAKKIKK
ncbi:MAG: hypothetical protein ACTSO2_09415 [Promethearchaeota archaeon]